MSKPVAEAFVIDPVLLNPATADPSRRCLGSPFRIYWKSLITPLNQGSFDHVKVGPTAVWELHNL